MSKIVLEKFNEMNKEWDNNKKISKIDKHLDEKLVKLYATYTAFKKEDELIFKNKTFAKDFMNKFNAEKVFTSIKGITTEVNTKLLGL